MFDPLSSTFGEEPQPPWPTTPRTPNTPIPNLPRPSSRPSSRPQTPDRRNGLYGRQPQIYGQPEPGLISPTVTTGSNGTKYEKVEPYLKVRITGLDRNRRDILVKFDAQVFCCIPYFYVILMLRLPRQTSQTSPVRPTAMSRARTSNSSSSMTP